MLRACALEALPTVRSLCMWTYFQGVNILSTVRTCMAAGCVVMHGCVTRSVLGEKQLVRAEAVAVAGLQGEVTASVWDGAPRALRIMLRCMPWLLQGFQFPQGARISNEKLTCKHCVLHGMNM